MGVQHTADLFVVFIKAAFDGAPEYWCAKSNKISFDLFSNF
jgi:hypothetical protein